jgi:NAD(P)H-binding
MSILLSSIPEIQRAEFETQKHAYYLSINYPDRFLNLILTNHSSLSQLITSYLVAKYPTVKINGIARSPSKVPAKFSANSNITIFEASSNDKAAVTKALKGSQVCICGYLGDNSLMTEGQKLLIDACIEAGVGRYIAGDWSADYRTVELGDVPMKDPMKIIYAYLQDKQAAGNAIRGVHIFNGGFTEALLANVFADEAHTKIHYFGSGDVGLDITTMPNVAAWTAEIAMDPSADGVINGT